MLINSLSSQIDVYLDMEQFKFESKNKTITLNTIVYIKYKEGKPTLASVGVPPENLVSIEKINLFSGKSSLDKLDMLIGFSAHGIKMVVHKYAMIRPTINCHGTKKFIKLFNGYEHGVFQKAFESAGALVVNFK